MVPKGDDERTAPLLEPETPGAPRGTAASSRAPSYYSLAGIALLPLTALALLVSLLFALALKAVRVLGRDLIDLRAFDFAYHAGWLAGPGLWFCLLRAPCLLDRSCILICGRQGRLIGSLHI